MRFVRAVPVEGSIFNVHSFDSEPRGSIARALGLDPETVELRADESRSTGRYRFYDVYGSQFAHDGRKIVPTLRGELRWEVPEHMR